MLPYPKSLFLDLSYTLASGKFVMGWRGTDSGAPGFRGCWSSGSIQINVKRLAVEGLEHGVRRARGRAALQLSAVAQGSRCADAGPPRPLRARSADHTKSEAAGWGGGQQMLEICFWKHNLVPSGFLTRN